MPDIKFYFKKYGKDTLIVILLLIIIFLIIYKNYIRDNDDASDISNEISVISPTEIKEETPEKITEEYLNVDLKGAINVPGVYKLKKDAIINDALALAGGFTKNAYTASINLSKKISDEMVIYIYTKDEIKKFTNNNENLYNAQEINNSCKTSNYDISECIEQKNSIIEKVEISTSDNNSNSTINTSENKETTKPNSDKTESTSKNIVNINTASETELTSLTGIGASKAKIIIEYRELNGPFKTINDIMNVKGIGESIFAKIKDYITV